MVLVLLQPIVIVFRAEPAIGAFDTRQMNHGGAYFPQHIQIVRQDDGRPGVELADQLYRFQILGLKIQQTRIEVRFAGRGDSTHQHDRPERGENEPAVMRAAGESGRIQKRKLFRANCRRLARVFSIAGKTV